MAATFFEEKRPHNGIKYADYKNRLAEFVSNTDPNTLDEKSLAEYKIKKLNLHRLNRIDKVYNVPEKLITIVKNIHEPQIWMVLSDDLCGDSAQNLPYIYKLVEQNPQIDLRILDRDENPDIMDLYLTNGVSRSIPKIIAFDTNGNEIFQWGPRPKEAQELVIQWKSSGLSKDELMEKLHLWYAVNRGKNLEQEFTGILCTLVQCKEAS